MAMDVPTTIIEVTAEVTFYGMLTEDQVDQMREHISNVLTSMSDQVVEAKVTLDDVADGSTLDTSCMDPLF